MIPHIRNLDEESLARQIYEEQKRNGWPGLHKESKIICEELNIEDCNTTSLSKYNFRKLITTACHRKNEIFLRATASEVKCRRIQNEDYGQKEYLSMKTIHESRSWYRTRFGLQPFAGNYSHDRKFAKTNWLCKCGRAREEEGHIVPGRCMATSRTSLGTWERTQTWCLTSRQSWTEGRTSRGRTWGGSLILPQLLLDL